MSLVEIKSILTLEQPLPGSVWAALLAMIFLVALLRYNRFADILPREFAAHSGKIWLVLFAFPILLIVLVMRQPEPAGSDKAIGQVPRRSEPERQSRIPQSVEAVKPAARLELPPECRALQDSIVGISRVTSSDGRQYLVAKQALSDVEAKKRFEAFRVLAGQAKALLSDYMSGTIANDVRIDPSARSISQDVRIRSRMNLFSVVDKAACYDGETAWVVVEMPLTP
jgi:hypothetical protein